MALLRFPDGPPPGLFDLAPVPLLEALGGPTWVRVPGTGQQPPRAVSTLLHGDEPTGLLAVRHLLRRPRTRPFDLHVIVFNVEAALAGAGFAHRYLDHQEDGNRLWGGAGPDTSQRAAAEAILVELLAEPLDLLVDIHNTTGDNPFHAVVPADDPATRALAARFTTTLLRWELGNGTLMERIAPTAPAIAVECGLAGRRTSLGFAVDGLRRVLGPRLDPTREDPEVEVIGDLLRVTVPDHVRLRFGGQPDDDVDAVLPIGGDAANLVEVPAGHELARVRPGAGCPLQVTDAHGTDVTERELAVTADGRVVTRQPRLPVMVVRTVEAVRKDCLCYLARELPVASPARG